MTAENGEARNPRGIAASAAGQTVSCGDVQQGLAERPTVTAGAACCQASVSEYGATKPFLHRRRWHKTANSRCPYTDDHTAAAPRSSYCKGVRLPFGLPQKPTVVDHETAVLDDLDAGASERLRHFVMADAKLHPDHVRLGREDIGQMRRNISRPAEDVH